MRRWPRPLRASIRRAAETVGFRVLEGTFYDPVPDPAELTDATFAQVSSLLGITLDLDAQIAWAEEFLRHHVRAFAAGPTAWRSRNSFYETGDAEIAYAMVRWLKPARVVELGSGWSSLVLAHGIRENPDAARYEVFNPYPAEVIAGGVPGLEAQHAVRAQDVPLEVFAALEADDLLFVDTSHTVKLGGDVNRIVLDILPRLNPGVVVHFHDIWLPHEYHPTLVRDMRMYWSEQYLLQAFLSGNDAWEIIFATRAVAAAMPDRFRELVPGFPTGELFPSSFWIRRRAHDA